MTEISKIQCKFSHSPEILFVCVAAAGGGVSMSAGPVTPTKGGGVCSPEPPGVAGPMCPGELWRLRFSSASSA